MEPPAEEGEERRTRGWKERPQRVFTMLELKKEKKLRGERGGGGGGGGGFRDWKECEMKRREKKGGFI